MLILSFIAGVLYAGLLSFPDFMHSGVGGTLDRKFAIVGMGITYRTRGPIVACGFRTNPI